MDPMAVGGLFVIGILIGGWLFQDDDDDDD